jgi:hypothetical protein
MTSAARGFAGCCIRYAQNNFGGPAVHIAGFEGPQNGKLDTFRASVFLGNSVYTG